MGLIAWIGTGNHLMTPLTWLGTAALAGNGAGNSRRHSTVARVAIPVAVAGATAFMVKRAREDLKKQQLVAEETNKYLETFTPPLRGDDHPEPFVAAELIARYQQRKVRSYWRPENLWGNLESNPDPVRKQNVMLTGFYGLQIAAYQSATGARSRTASPSACHRGT